MNVECKITSTLRRRQPRTSTLLLITVALVVITSRPERCSGVDSFVPPPRTPEQGLSRRNAMHTVALSAASPALLGFARTSEAARRGTDNEGGPVLSRGETFEVDNIPRDDDQGQRKLKKVSKWAGEYRDPVHKGCERKVILDFKGTKAKITGLDGPDGGDCEGNPEVGKTWTARGVLAKFDADEMTVESPDFSITTRESKSGNKPVVAKWDEDGILFPDGTKWMKKGR